MNITTQLKEVLADLPEGVRLVAVSKFHPASAIQEAYDAGQRIFGESREQELSVNQPALAQDIEWRGGTPPARRKRGNTDTLPPRNPHRTGGQQIWIHF